MRKALFILIFTGCVQLAFSIEVYEEPKLHSSIRTRNISLFEQILSSEENLNVRNSRGQSPLTIAMILSEKDMMVSLLKNGAQLDLTNEIDRRALKYASRPVKKILKQYHQIKRFCWLSFGK